MADHTDFEQRVVWRTIGGGAAVLALACCLLLLSVGFGPSKADESVQRELATVTFVVGGMMKSRSGAT